MRSAVAEHHAPDHLHMMGFAASQFVMVDARPGDPVQHNDPASRERLHGSERRSLVVALPAAIVDTLQDSAVISFADTTDARTVGKKVVSAADKWVGTASVRRTPLEDGNSGDRMSAPASTDGNFPVAVPIAFVRRIGHA